MKLFLIIVAAILVSAALIALAVGVYSAKSDHDKFMRDSQQAVEAAKQEQNSN